MKKIVRDNVFEHTQRAAFFKSFICSCQPNLTLQEHADAGAEDDPEVVVEQDPASHRVRRRRHLPQPFRDSPGNAEAVPTARQHRQPGVSVIKHFFFVADDEAK
jgi:hypothetical protein